jgi:hypothetical protein
MSPKLIRQLILLVILANSGCISPSGAAQSGENHISPSLTVSEGTLPGPISNSVERDGVVVNVIVERSVYQPDQIVKVQAWVENRGDAPVDYWMPSIDGYVIPIWVDAEIIGRIDLSEPGPLRMMRGEIGHGTLEPGQRVDREVVWDQILKEGVYAGAGVYLLRAGFRPTKEGVDHDGEIDPIVATVELSIEGTPSLLRSEQAIAVLIGDPFFNEWYQANGSLLICKTADGGELALEDGRITAVTEAHRARLSSAGSPVCGVRLLEGPVWALNYANKEGQLQGQYQIIIDAQDGAILSKKQHR